MSSICFRSRTRQCGASTSAAPLLSTSPVRSGEMSRVHMPSPVRTDESETKGWWLRHDNDRARRKANQLLGHATKQQPCKASAASPSNHDGIHLLLHYRI